MLKSQDIVILLKLIALQGAQQNALTYAVAEPTPAWQGGSKTKSVASAADAIIPAAMADESYSMRSLESSLGLSKSEISQSLRRSLDSGLALRPRQSAKPQPNSKALYDLIVHGLKYVFPAKQGQLARGIATGVDAPVFNPLLHSVGGQNYVWPDAQGTAYGQSVEPLYRSVPQAVRRDAHLYAMLALVDAIRLGRARESAVAAQELKQRMGLA